MTARFDEIELAELVVDASRLRGLIDALDLLADHTSDEGRNAAYAVLQAARPLALKVERAVDRISDSRPVP